MKIGGSFHSIRFYAYLSIQTHVYYIYTIQQLRYPRESLQFFVLYNNYDAPGNHYNSLLIYKGALLDQLIGFS